MSRRCFECGNNGHNCGTCGGRGGGGGEKGIMLFGVRVSEAKGEGSFRKSVSMNNLCQFDQPTLQEYSISNADAGYASDDVVHASGTGRTRDRKRGVPWTEEEHRLFLLGLQKVGKGDWRGVSRNFVKTRTPTQVASHAQKYFLRRNNQNRRRRRSSLFDITTVSFIKSTILEEDEQPQPQMNIGYIPNSYFMENLTLGSNSSPNPNPTVPLPPPSAKMAHLNPNLNHNTQHDPLPLSLKLSTPSADKEKSTPPPAAAHSSSFQAISSG